jgi:flagellar P-ring protein precursor FlgI
MKQRHNCIKLISLLVAAVVVMPLRSDAARLKDIADIEGVRGNQLVGYGLVVGLNGTGDKRGSSFTPQSVANLLERLGVRVDPEKLKLANVAAVIVTTTLPPFSRPGSKLDVTLSSLGDASTLQGGTLVATPLKGVDGKIYAVAQGAISVGGFTVEGGGDSAQKNHPTVGRVALGATVEKSIPFDLFASGQVKIVLREADFITVTRVEEAINGTLGSNRARAIDSGNVVINLDNRLDQSPIHLVAQLENINVEPDLPARVVVNERTGTIIMGENVRVSTVALAHGNLNITIKRETQVSQPNALAEGDTAVVENAEVAVTEEEGKFALIKQSVSLGEVVSALNGLGATPRDLIAIFQALKQAGALQADLVLM